VSAEGADRKFLHLDVNAERLEIASDDPRVPVRVDLVPVELLDRRSDDLRMRRENVGVRLGQLMDQARRPPRCP
jgi:hypothetical protein